MLSKWKNQYWGKFTVLKEVPKTSGKKSTNLLISSNDSSEKDSIEDNSSNLATTETMIRAELKREKMK